jgi:hypothetical protein
VLFLGGLLGEASAEVNGVWGQTLYVPVYSEIPYGDRDHTLDLTATLSIRNMDRKVAITVRTVDYYNAQGERPLAETFLWMAHCRFNTCRTIVQDKQGYARRRDGRTHLRSITSA